MGRRNVTTLDLALTETFNARINAVRDVMRAELAVTAARRENRPLGVENALRALSNAVDRAAVAKSNLDVAIAAEAAERA